MRPLSLVGLELAPRDLLRVLVPALGARKGLDDHVRAQPPVLALLAMVLVLEEDHGAAKYIRDIKLVDAVVVRVGER